MPHTTNTSAGASASTTGCTSASPDFDNARDALHWAHAAGESELELRIGTTMLRALPPSLHDERMALADAVRGLHRRAAARAAAVAGMDRTELCAGRYAEGTRPATPPSARWLSRAASTPHSPTASRSTTRWPGRRALPRRPTTSRRRDRCSTSCNAIEDPAWPPQRLLWGAEAVQWVARMGGDTAEALRRGRRLLALDRERGSHASIATGNLIDAELAAGDAKAAADLGAELVESLRGTRHEYSLSFARINLLAALLAQDDAARARSVAQQAWSHADAFELQHAAAAYLALLAALEGRPRAAVQLAAYSEALYATRNEAREQNETAATLRAQQLARRALDEATCARLQAEGAALRDAEIAAVAFARDDVS